MSDKLPTLYLYKTLRFISLQMNNNGYFIEFSFQQTNFQVLYNIF